MPVRHTECSPCEGVCRDQPQGDAGGYAHVKYTIAYDFIHRLRVPPKRPFLRGSHDFCRGSINGHDTRSDAIRIPDADKRLDQPKPHRPNAGVAV